MREKEFHLLMCFVLGGFVFFYSCGDNDEQIAQEKTTSTSVLSTPFPEPTLLPSPTPSPIPTLLPTPTPKEPTFGTIISNLGFMTDEQKEKYSEDLSGIEIQNWSGWVMDKYTLALEGEVIAVVMGKPKKTRPDVALMNIPHEKFTQLKKGDALRFSGRIKNIGKLQHFSNILCIENVKIHGIDE